ncbi:hypothetical protein pdam_00013645 [Pocillopora damicornis]|uniref:Uncharacterized protein n=1 Tax=Pocillopora damicornis TaxID=46731 RepID=A0A3M6ULF4_POCDA|nr:hypothetical protein pdam_00013645 [Pocillopora damicornis]
MIAHLENSIALKSVSFKGGVLYVGTSTLSGFLTSQVGRGTGSLPQWQYGSVNCIIVKNITEHCLGGKAPAYFGRNYQCGPAYKLKGGDYYYYYYFDGCTGEDFPAHDPCGSYSDKELKNIQNPHGNIFIR